MDDEDSFPSGYDAESQGGDAESQGGDAESQGGDAEESEETDASSEREEDLRPKLKKPAAPGPRIGSGRAVKPPSIYDAFFFQNNKGVNGNLPRPQEQAGRRRSQDQGHLRGGSQKAKRNNDTVKLAMLAKAGGPIGKMVLITWGRAKGVRARITSLLVGIDGDPNNHTRYAVSLLDDSGSVSSKKILSLRSFEVLNDDEPLRTQVAAAAAAVREQPKIPGKKTQTSGQHPQPPVAVALHKQFSEGQARLQAQLNALVALQEQHGRRLETQARQLEEQRDRIHTLEKQCAAYARSLGEGGNTVRVHHGRIACLELNFEKHSGRIKALQEQLQSLLQVSNKKRPAATITPATAPASAASPPVAISRAPPQSSSSQKSKQRDSTGTSSSSFPGVAAALTWKCATCTFANNNEHGTECAVCSSARPNQKQQRR